MGADPKNAFGEHTVYQRERESKVGQVGRSGVTGFSAMLCKCKWLHQALTLVASKRESTPQLICKEYKKHLTSPDPNLLPRVFPNYFKTFLFPVHYIVANLTGMGEQGFTPNLNLFVRLKHLKKKILNILLVFICLCIY